MTAPIPPLRDSQLSFIDGMERPVGRIPHSVQTGTNADLIANIAPIYLTGSVLDVTYGKGAWWARFEPEDFTAHDLYTLDGVDFTALPEADRSVATVCAVWGVAHHLSEAATIWHLARGFDGLDFHEGGYSGSANRFVWLAERASSAAMAQLPAPVPEADDRPPKSGCYLYRLWQDDGRLLYIGVSTNLRSRLRSHRRRWPDLWETATWEEHPDESSMLAAEKEAIANELPALNRAGIT